MYKPDKTTTERNAKTLRELVKQPDNKVCADCKRNDPRWASWNLGVFLCIRCSGIHRGMGTHISRVKSIDLDMWTPEQMDSVQKWGNRRANLYWEAHIKAGHVPPDHKMESFIRSKYESRRWAMEGPLPSDPSVLEGPAQSSSTGAVAPSTAATTSAPLFDNSPAPSAPARQKHVHSPTRSLSLPTTASPTLTNEPRHQPHQSRQLLSTAVAGRVNAQGSLVSPTPAQPQQQQSQQQQPPQQQPANADFFTLDFHAPVTANTAPAPAPPAKDVKQDILSLFSASPAAPQPQTHTQPANAFGQFGSVQSSWDAFGAARPQAQAQAQTQPQPISMMGNSGTGVWGVSSGWNGAIPNATPSSNIWGTAATTTTTTTNNTFATTDIWGGSSATTTSTTNSLFASQPAAASKKDDVFGDLWGDFK